MQNKDVNKSEKLTLLKDKLRSMIKTVSASRQQNASKNQEFQEKSPKEENIEKHQKEDEFEQNPKKNSEDVDQS